MTIYKYIIINTTDIQHSLLSAISNPNLGAAPSVSTQLLHVLHAVPLLKDTLERTPLYKGHKLLAAGTGNACDAPSHQRTPL